MVPENPRETYAALVREAMRFDMPTPVRRDEAIRELAQPAPFNIVHIITGVRRCGKTFYLFQKIHDLLDAGVPRSRIFYFNFSDDRLRPMPDDILDDIVNEYWRQVPSAREEGAYLFLDEVQECANWQGFCQRLAEREKVTLTITGSSSKLSSDEIATTFRGRSHPHEMMPLSFREYCLFHNLATPDPSDTSATFSPQETTAFESAYERYLVTGGFPAVQHALEPDRIELLQGYLRDVVARDVAERFGRENIALATQTALYALRNTACELSVNSLVEALKTQGWKVYWDKINTLLALFKQAYLVYELQEYQTTLKPDSTSVPKLYAVDPGMAYAVSRANQQDVGKRLETAVFGELRRRTSGKRTEAVTSYTMPTARQEKVDFLVGDAMAAEPYALYQVTADMEAEKTRAREIGSLDAVMRRTGLTEGTIITLREEGGETTEAGRIRIIPAWKWALLG
ncbi:ATPase AAA [Bifidobacterium lemurum]|uniref:ATPase AAA n=1 Tax=Bifidobacterium lemurum TaxID=1603886 RepID=A0A261FKP5_9BIFI|nr:ATP-binding protein [Bifidobacterium lemurum]OZG59729.1 ATPase AAA [Bifidobacterium lemurum]QOL35023.1 ATP-binding protein [Bifidobacterium lemurum]